RQPEIRIDHAEWREDALVQNLAERFAFDAADQEAEHIGGMAIMKLLAGLIGQGQRAESGQPFVRSEAVHGGIAQRLIISLLERSFGEEAVCNARAMREQIFYRDRTTQRHGAVQGPGGLLKHAYMGKFWNPAGD